MRLWLAVNDKLESLGVQQSHTSEQAYYQFMKENIYPHNVVELPNSVVLRLDEQIREDDTNSDGYYFSDRD